ncbi:MAG: phosphatase PAP2 family protein [Microscillaceae bacterium]|jgi:membrane-associated phospholipid phosphatase|nr:phosphatase PAP2 family protein [Microscillaceae bacterium]
MNFRLRNSNLKSIFINFLTLSLICIFLILWIDQPLTLLLHQNFCSLSPFFGGFTAFFDHLIYSPRFWLGYQNGYWVEYMSFGFLRHWLLLILFGVFYSLRKGFSLVFLQIIATHWSTTLVVSILKINLPRARPETLLETGKYDLNFLAGNGDSFPSGHAGDYLGFFLPLAFGFPKYAFGILLIPFLISLGRIFLFQHYLSDVLFSINLALFFTLIFRLLLPTSQH